MELQKNTASISCFHLRCGIWYPSQACWFLKLQHHIHSAYEKSVIERTKQYIKKIELYNTLMIIFLAVEEKRTVN
jgi:hypothetical protein